MCVQRSKLCSEDISQHLIEDKISILSIDILPVISVLGKSLKFVLDALMKGTDVKSLNCSDWVAVPSLVVQLYLRFRCSRTTGSLQVATQVSEVI